MNKHLPKICTAPFSSVLIDINKNIKPCNQYAEGPIMRDSQEEFTRDEFVPGNLNDSTLRDVLNNDQYKELRENMHDGIVPKGCEWCLQREKETGFSQRQAFMPPGAETYSNNKNTSYNGRLYYEDWHKGITVLELDTSNICNLTCAGCDSFFSSMWKTIEDTIEPADNNRFYMHDKPYRNVPYEFHIGDKLISEFAGVNLSYLKRVIYKGGEPFLNKDMIVSLRYFDRIGILPNLTIGITTNGTVVNPLIIRLLDRAKRVEIVLSVDGADEVNRYIRHSPTNLSSTLNLVNFCNQFHNSSRYVISMMPTIMVYNIFSLDKLLDWWLFEMKPRYDNAGIKTLSPVFYSSHFLRNKAWLTLRTLQPYTIKQLIKYYEEKSKDPKYKNINKNSNIKSHSNPFENLIYVLKNTEYGGDMLHDQMVKYTKDMDAIKGQNVLDAVPELKKEMVYLTVKHQGAHGVKLQEHAYTRFEIFCNKIKQRFANNKTYVTDLGSIRDPK